MTVYLRLFSLAALLTYAGCSSYETVVIRKAINPPENLILVGDAGMEEDDAAGITAGLKFYESPRYLAKKGSSPACSRILEAGVREAVSGNLFEAGVLFLELKDRENNGSVENNLGVVYEKSGRYIDAFGMYSSAVRLDPDNGLYRRNLFLFITSRGLSQKNVTGRKRK